MNALHETISLMYFTLTTRRGCSFSLINEAFTESEKLTANFMSSFVIVNEVKTLKLLTNKKL